jgi:uncharacterized membrane protein YcaP (DUF421 family)
MIDQLKHLGETVLGLGEKPTDLTILQTSCRAAVIFFAALLMLRLAHKRFFAQKNSVDVLLALILASTISRAINGSAPFFGTIAAGFVMVLMHNALTRLAFKSKAVGNFSKGRAFVLVQDGRIDEEALRAHHVSRNDLEEDLRLKKGSEDLQQVQKAVLERSGEISFQKRPTEFTVQVEKGVQTIRIQMGG